MDKTPPKLQLHGEEITLSSIEFFAEGGYEASDNYDGDLTSDGTVPRDFDESASMCIMTYTVKDSSNNTASAHRRISVRDLFPPQPVLLGDSEIYTHVADFCDPGYRASDDLEGNLTNAVVVESDFVSYTVGDFTITNTVSDGSGNTVSASRLVHVTDNTPPPPFSHWKSECKNICRSNIRRSGHKGIG